MDDPNGVDFPWKPPTFWEALGDEFLSGDGDSVDVADLKGAGKVIGLYFSAHWCPPCKGFTPVLVETYKKVKAAGKQFEMIFVSSDRDQTQFMEYFKEMPWLAIPQGDKRKNALSKRFEVEGIPCLVLVDAETGETITKNGRGAVGGDPEGKDFPWYPKPVTDLAVDGEGLNEETCLCALLEGCPAPAQEAGLAALTAVATAHKKEGGEVLFTDETADDINRCSDKIEPFLQALDMQGQLCDASVEGNPDQRCPADVDNRVCDLLVKFDKGKVVESGKHYSTEAKLE